MTSYMIRCLEETWNNVEHFCWLNFSMQVTQVMFSTFENEHYYSSKKNICATMQWKTSKENCLYTRNVQFNVSSVVSKMVGLKMKCYCPRIIHKQKKWEYEKVKKLYFQSQFSMSKINGYFILLRISISIFC